MELSLHDAPERVFQRARAMVALRPLTPVQQAALARFPRRRRKAVGRLALSHPYLADLMVSFPTAIFMLAHGQRSRTRAAEGLAWGAAERHVADAYMPVHWHRAMSIRSAAEAAADWRLALRFELSETPTPINVRPPADNAVGP